MNIIYIHTHDTGRFISPYGYALPTPNLFKLAEDGVLFRNAYCAAPTCSPSRSSMLTGMCAHASGMLGLAHRGFKITDYSKHIASYFTSQGIHTALCGIHHEANDINLLGYSEIIRNGKKFTLPEQSVEYDMANAEAAADFIMNHDENAPFFLSFGMFNTHRPYPGNDICNPDYVMPPFTVADTPENRADYAGFVKSVAVADKCAGMVIEAVRKKGIWDNTLIMYTTDHGMPWPGMKCNLFDAGIGVSLIFAGGGMPKGVCRNEMISHLDIFPTLCEFMNVPVPDWCEGKSALNLAKNGEKIRDCVFSEVSYHASYQPMRAVRTEKYKYIKLFYDVSIPCYPNIDDSPSKSILTSNPGFRQINQDEMLFDLECDPLESQNLAGNPQYKDVLNEMRAKLKNWMKDTSDPLLNGKKIPKPHGAVVNTMDSLSAEDTEYEQQDQD